MKTQQFEIAIEAPAEKVWDVLFGESTYPQWTAVFCEGSKAETDWKKGSKALFVDGNNNGMVSEIAENIPNSFMSIRHLGELKNGVEDLQTAQSKGWSGLLENYTLKSEGNKTNLLIEMGLVPEFEDYFLKTWPKALEKVKQLAEE